MLIKEGMNHEMPINLNKLLGFLNKLCFESYCVVYILQKYKCGTAELFLSLALGKNISSH